MAQTESAKRLEQAKNRLKNALVDLESTVDKKVAHLKQAQNLATTLEIKKLKEQTSSLEKLIVKEREKTLEVKRVAREASERVDGLVTVIKQRLKSS